MDDPELVMDLMNQALDDSGYTMFELACLMKCSVSSLRRIMNTGKITERQWKNLDNAFAEIYDTTKEMEAEYLYG